MSSPVTTLDLIRHGEPVGGRKYRGQTDDPLSEKGWRQMRQAVGDFCPWHVIVSSPLSRCAAFATELSERHQLPLHVDSRLQEIGFGEWEGKTAEQLRAVDPEILTRFLFDPIRYRPRGAEELQSFHDRIVSAWNDIVQLHRQQHILVVAHAGVIRMMLAHILDMPLPNVFRIQVGNASITRIQVEHHKERDWPRLMFHDGKLA